MLDDVAANDSKINNTCTAGATKTFVINYQSSNEISNAVETRGNSVHESSCTSHHTCGNSKPAAVDPDIVNNNLDCDF